MLKTTNKELDSCIRKISEQCEAALRIINTTGFKRTDDIERLEQAIGQFNDIILDEEDY